MFKYYNRIHQTSNEKVCLNLICLVIFKHTWYLLLLYQRFSKALHYKLKEKHDAFIMLF
jgi:hypothetical protein